MRYTIEWIESKVTSTGKKKADATLTDASGVQTEGVTLWSDFPLFDSLKAGSEVEGDVVVKVSGRFTNKTLYAPKGNLRQFRPTPTGIKAAQERKSADIATAQDRKEESIKLASAARDATLIVTTFYAKDTVGVELDIKEEFIKLKWKEWQKWFMSNFGDGLPF